MTTTGNKSLLKTAVEVDIVHSRPLGIKNRMNKQKIRLKHGKDGLDSWTTTTCNDTNNVCSFCNIYKSCGSPPHLMFEVVQTSKRKYYSQCAVVLIWARFYGLEIA